MYPHLRTEEKSGWCVARTSQGVHAATTRHTPCLLVTVATRHSVTEIQFLVEYRQRMQDFVEVGASSFLNRTMFMGNSESWGPKLPRKLYVFCKNIVWQGVTKTPNCHFILRISCDSRHQEARRKAGPVMQTQNGNRNKNVCSCNCHNLKIDTCLFLEKKKGKEKKDGIRRRDIFMPSLHKLCIDMIEGSRIARWEMANRFLEGLCVWLFLSCCELCAVVLLLILNCSFSHFWRFWSSLNSLLLSFRTAFHCQFIFRQQICCHHDLGVILITTSWTCWITTSFLSAIPAGDVIVTFSLHVFRTNDVIWLVKTSFATWQQNMDNEHGEEPILLIWKMDATSNWDTKSELFPDTKTQNKAEMKSKSRPVKRRKQKDVFIGRLRRLLEDPEVNTVSWHPSGKAIMVDKRHIDEQVSRAFPDSFGKNKFTSIRQNLASHGFKSACRRQNINDDIWKKYKHVLDSNRFLHIYEHPLFRREKPEQDNLIKRIASYYKPRPQDSNKIIVVKARDFKGRFSRSKDFQCEKTGKTCTRTPCALRLFR